MPEIVDTGKVWTRGAYSPEYAVKVEDKVFVTGQKEDDFTHFWIDGNFLCVDLHNKQNGERRARRFSLDLPTTTPGSLFDGFEKTRHTDIEAVTYRDNGVEEFVVDGEVYRAASVGKLDSKTFWALAEF